MQEKKSDMSFDDCQQLEFFYSGTRYVSRREQAVDFVVLLGSAKVQSTLSTSQRLNDPNVSPLRLQLVHFARNDAVVTNEVLLYITVFLRLNPMGENPPDFSRLDGLTLPSHGALSNAPWWHLSCKSLSIDEHFFTVRENLHQFFSRSKGTPRLASGVTKYVSISRTFPNRTKKSAS